MPPGGSADRGAVARLQPVRQDNLHGARSCHAVAGHPRWVLRRRPHSTICRARHAEPGLQEFGLPYASDPVISKHLARFLTRSLQNVKASDKLAALVGARADGQALMPTAVLFNGGVFKAAPIRARVLELLASWNGGQAVRELEGFEPDLAVAQGAAIYGRHRATGKGMRIKAGAARSYYVGLESSMPAIPGFRPPVKALCVVPQGMQEGTELLIEGRTFGLVTGQPADFRFFSSAVRSGDTPGQVVARCRTRAGRDQPVGGRASGASRHSCRAVVPVQIEVHRHGARHARTLDEAHQLRPEMED